MNYKLNDLGLSLTLMCKLSLYYLRDCRYRRHKEYDGSINYKSASTTVGYNKRQGHGILIQISSFVEISAWRSFR